MSKLNSFTLLSFKLDLFGSFFLFYLILEMAIMDLMIQFFYTLLAPLILIHLTYFLAIQKNNFSLIDLVWSLGFLAIVSTGFLLQDRIDDYKSVALFITINVWALRLFIYLFKRNWSKAEDFRYAQMRQGW
jgi:steroid 5-alpha reductase family enzyme